MTEFRLTPKSGRMLILSDCHMDHFDGVGGYSAERRMQLMLNALLCQREYDGIIFAGDMTSRNVLEHFSLEPLLRFKHSIVDALQSRGIPAYCINASHDAMTSDEFSEVFGYDGNFTVIHGDVVYVCLDTYAGERDDTLQTTESDIDDGTLADALELIARDSVKAAFAVCHWPNGGTNLTRLMRDGHITALIAGHTHENHIFELSELGFDADKKLLLTGHFARSHTKRVNAGQGFAPFAAMTCGDGLISDDFEPSRLIENFSRTGSPWQYRAVARVSDGVESYMIFPQMTYGEFVSDGITFPAFKQPYAEGFGDRSYIKFPI